MTFTLDDLNTVVDVTIVEDNGIPKAVVKGFEGDLWNDLIPKLLASNDIRASEVVTELLFWLEANNVKNDGKRSPKGNSAGTGDDSTVGAEGNDNKCTSMSNSYLESFVETLKNFKASQGVRMVQAMAGHQPILIYKTLEGRYCFSFPPETMVFTIDDVKEMARTGRYTFGKRYMDKLLEVL